VRLCAFHRFPNIIFPDNVIPVKNAPRLVAGDGHGDLLRHPGSDHVSDRSAPQIVKELACYPCIFARPTPGTVVILNAFALVVEHPGNEVDPLRSSALDNLGNDPNDGEDAPFCVLGVLSELLKAEFNGRWVTTPSGGKRKVAMSSKGKKVLRELVNRVTDWMGEQGIPVPDPTLYKKYRDSGLMAGEGSYREWLAEQGLQSDGTPIT
jgi:hypothetical protein